MSQSLRINEMENYIKKVGELLNLVYKKETEVEAKVNSFEAELAKLQEVSSSVANVTNLVNSFEAELTKLREEIEALKAENARLKENVVTKAEYEEFVGRLIGGLKGLLPETPGERTSEA